MSSLNVSILTLDWASSNKSSEMFLLLIFCNVLFTMSLSNLILDEAWKKNKIHIGINKILLGKIVTEIFITQELLVSLVTKKTYDLHVSCNSKAGIFFLQVNMVGFIQNKYSWLHPIYGHFHWLSYTETPWDEY